jgi:hypothetical protein
VWHIGLMWENRGWSVAGLHMGDADIGLCDQTWWWHWHGSSPPLAVHQSRLSAKDVLGLLGWYGWLVVGWNMCTGCAHAFNRGSNMVEQLLVRGSLVADSKVYLQGSKQLCPKTSPRFVLQVH